MINSGHYKTVQSCTCLIDVPQSFILEYVIHFCFHANYDSKKVSTYFLKSHMIKGQLVLKKNVKSRILPKNERMNSFLLVYVVGTF